MSIPFLPNTYNNKSESQRPIFARKLAMRGQKIEIKPNQKRRVKEFPVRATRNELEPHLLRPKTVMNIMQNSLRILRAAWTNIQICHMTPNATGVCEQSIVSKKPNKSTKTFRTTDRPNPFKQ
ncbi:tetratricopeptide repeat protein [Sesbania bispinosa]|nr:tetratricopeptide repeat protein [Sesbania bispinosa]